VTDLLETFTDISPNGHFAYETVRLLDTSPTTWIFRLRDISPPIKLLDRCNKARV